MKAVTSRLSKLEKIFAPPVEVADRWGSMAELRDQFLNEAKQQGEEVYAKAKEDLDSIGPSGMRSQLILSYIKPHGFVPGPNDSVAMTIARALGIDTSQLVGYLREGRLGTELIKRFDGVEIATDNCS